MAWRKPGDASPNVIPREFKLLCDFYDAVEAECKAYGVYDGHAYLGCSYEFCDPGWSREKVVADLHVHADGTAHLELVSPVIDDKGRTRLGGAVRTVPAHIGYGIQPAVSFLYGQWPACDRMKHLGCVSTATPTNKTYSDYVGRKYLYERILDGIDAHWAKMLMQYFTDNEGVDSADVNGLIKNDGSELVEIFIDELGCRLCEIPEVVANWEKLYAQVMEAWKDSADTGAALDLVTGEYVEDNTTVHIATENAITGACRTPLFSNYPTKDTKQANISKGRITGLRRPSLSIGTSIRVFRAFELLRKARLMFVYDNDVIYYVVMPWMDAQHELTASDMREIVYAVVHGTQDTFENVSFPGLQVAELHLASDANGYRAMLKGGYMRSLDEMLDAHRVLVETMREPFGIEDPRYTRDNDRTFLPFLRKCCGCTYEQAAYAMEAMRTGEPFAPSVVASLAEYVVRSTIAPRKKVDGYNEWLRRTVSFRVLANAGYPVSEEVMTMYQNDNPLYLLGCLLAAVEYAQRNATDVAHTIREKVFGKAASNPRAAAILLFEMSANYGTPEPRTRKVMSTVVGQHPEAFAENMPITATDEDKLMFFVGYYQQNSVLYLKQSEFDAIYGKTEEDSDETVEDGEAADE